VLTNHFSTKKKEKNRFLTNTVNDRVLQTPSQIIWERCFLCVLLPANIFWKDFSTMVYPFRIHLIANMGLKNFPLCGAKKLLLLTLFVVLDLFFYESRLQ